MNAKTCLAAVVAFATITAVHAQIILVPNGDMELGTEPDGLTPLGWGYYASGPNAGAPRTNGVTDVIAQSGTHSLYFTTSETQGAGYEAHYLRGMNSLVGDTPISLTTTSEVSLSFYIRSDVLTPFAGDAVARFQLEFHDSTQNGNPNVGGTGTLLSLHFANDGFSTSEWIQVTLTGSPNAFSDNILFVADYQNFPEGSYTSSSGTFYLDNLTAFVVPEPSSIALVLGGIFSTGLICIARQRRLALR